MASIDLRNDPIPSSFRHDLLPVVSGMVVKSLYVLVDSIKVGRGVAKGLKFRLIPIPSSLPSQLTQKVLKSRFLPLSSFPRRRGFIASRGFPPSRE